MFHDGRIDLKEFGPSSGNLKEVEALIWRDCFDTNKDKADFNSDRSVVGNVGVPIDIHYQYIYNYYVVGFTCRNACQCSINVNGIGGSNETVISDTDCRLESF